MMRFWVILSVSLLLIKVVSSALPGNAKATYSCTKSGADNVLTVTYTYDTAGNPTDSTGDSFTTLFVKGQYTNGHASCQATRASTSDATETTLQVTVALTTDACGLTVDGAGNVLTADALLVLTTLTTGVLQSTDQQLTITAATCDFSAAIAQQTPDVSSVAITDFLDTGTVSLLVPDVTLTLIDSGNAGIVACTLGDDVRLKLSLDLTSGGATGVHARSCTASPFGGNGGGTVNLLTASCTSGIVGSAASEGFTYDVSSPAGSYVSVMTTKFDCFRFDGSMDMTISCTVDFCTSDITAPTPPATGNLCQAGADSCGLIAGAAGLGTRKRRDTGTHNLNETKVSFTINIGQPSDTNPVSANDKKDVNEVCSGLLHQTTFIVTVSILAALLLVTMAISAFSVKKARDARYHNTPPPYAMKGVENPAF